MKKFNIILLVFASLATFACIDNPEEIPFDIKVEGDRITTGPEGGVYKIQVNASGNWTAMTAKPWITVSPANGRGSVVCDVKVDSAFSLEPRDGQVLIEMMSGDGVERKSFDVSQAGYEYIISLDKEEVEVKNYDVLEKRNFSIIVNANTEIDVKFMKGEDNVQLGNDWITFEKKAIDLPSGLRPRNVKVNFKWDVNSKMNPREAKIQILPKDEGIDASVGKILTVKQPAADPIEVGTAKGDAQALIAIARSVSSYASTWDISKPLSQWENVRVWTEDDIEDIKKMIKNDPRYDTNTDWDKVALSFVGRVRYVMFYIFATKEQIPFEIEYLDAAEEINFYGNANSFLLDLTPGEHIAKLTQLKRLTMVAYGLKSLDSHFLNLKNLEFLDLGSNNFEEIPAELTPENFPELHSLNLGANQRSVIYDLSNTASTDYGGLVKSVEDPDNGGFPERLLRWEKLDTLTLSVNYLFGTLPTCEDESWPKYDQADIDKAVDDLKEDKAPTDTIGAYMIGKPKVLPNAKSLKINLNRLSGTLPNWILYHPCLDLWIPDIFIFNQEGTDPNGKPAKFDNVPLSLSDYSNLTYGEYGDDPDKVLSYYGFHTFKKKK